MAARHGKSLVGPLISNPVAHNICANVYFFVDNLAELRQDGVPGWSSRQTCSSFVEMPRATLHAGVTLASYYKEAGMADVMRTNGGRRTERDSTARAAQRFALTPRSVGGHHGTQEK